ncbi:MAG: 3-methyl-2-oxobutanoate hydroxymethyltransferase [Phycisphaerales bacterium]|nr:3-methyl-2-oxobutanoate hydroxymethyltransferase [Phycisphaerales bacterium]
MTPPRDKPITLQTLRAMTRAGTPFACLTAYDATTARWLERAGVPLLLVGDTAAEVVLGLPGTIHCPLDVLLALTAAVKRGAPSTMVMGDMPFMSYQADESEAIRNGGRFLTEGMADVVKLEVDGSWAPLVKKLDRAGVPVVAHIGSRPQRAKHDGGYRAAGRTSAQAASLVEDARRLEDAGASMLLVEAVPELVAEQIVEHTTVPVIGCGAGPACHGQVVVLHDILNLTDWQPAFARPLGDLATPLTEAATAWIERVAARDLGTHPYTMIDGQSASPAPA